MPEAQPEYTINPEPLILKTFNQSGQVKDRVEACARELSLANRALKASLAEYCALDSVREALTWSEVMEDKVRQCVDDLQLMNTSLAEEIAERKNLEQKLSDSEAQVAKHYYMAFHDSITGLANRALFNDRLEKTLIQARRHKRSFAIMFIDINNFKTINDTCGHDMGDKVLRIVGQRLEACVRKEDTASRAGGDEFQCLLLEVNADVAIANIAQSMIDCISETCGLMGIMCAVRPSIGIAICPRDGITAEMLLKNADMAMYQAKAQGIGYCFSNIPPTGRTYRWSEDRKNEGAEKSNGKLPMPFAVNTPKSRRE